MMSMNWDKNEMKHEIMNVKREVDLMKVMIIKQNLENE